MYRQQRTFTTHVVSHRGMFTQHASVVYVGRIDIGNIYRATRLYVLCTLASSPIVAGALTSGSVWLVPPRCYAQQQSSEGSFILLSQCLTALS